MIREDYIMRMIRQLGDFLAGIAGYNRRGKYAEALAEAERAWNELFDVPRELLEVIDTPALASLLGGPDQMRAASQLLAEEARALHGKGDPINAAVRFRRAYELRLEARAIAPAADDDGALLELSRYVHANQLDPRYRANG